MLHSYSHIKVPLSPLWPHQCPNGSALKTGKQEVSGSIPGRACRPCR